LGGGSIWALIKKRNPEAIAVLNEMEGKAEDDSKIKKAKVKKLEGSKPKKTSKDDSAVLKMKAKKSKEEFMKDVKIKPRAKDTSDLLAMAKKLKSVKTDDLKSKSDKITNYIKEFKNFLSLAKKSLEKSDPSINMFDKLSDGLDRIDATKIEYIPRDIKAISRQIRMEAEKRRC
jgi:preprotein translocase subunit Sss1